MFNKSKIYLVVLCLKILLYLFLNWAHVKVYKSVELYYRKVSVAICPSAGGRKGQNRWAKAFVSKGENEWSRHQRLLEENVRKTKKMKVCGIWKWGFGSCLHTRKVLAPDTPVTRDNNLSVHIVTSKWFSFPFFIFFPFLHFLFFWGRQGCCPRSYVSSGAMRKSDLRSSLSLKFCVLHWFYLFWKIYFNCEQKSFKVLDLETMF